MHCPKRKTVVFFQWMLTGLINHPDEESHTRVLEAFPEQCSALGKDWIPSCMCKWSWTSSKVIPTISKTCFLQLRSIGGIGKLQCFRQSDVPEIWGYLQHLSVYLPPLLGQMNNTSEWRYLWDWAQEALDCQASVLAFRGAAAHFVDYHCCWEKGAGFPAYCCRCGSQRSPSGWSCRIFSYPLHFRVSVSCSPLCSVLLEGCWGCETR